MGRYTSYGLFLDRPGSLHGPGFNEAIVRSGCGCHGVLHVAVRTGQSDHPEVCYIAHTHYQQVFAEEFEKGPGNGHQRIIIVIVTTGRRKRRRHGRSEKGHEARQPLGGEEENRDGPLSMHRVGRANYPPALVRSLQCLRQGRTRAIFGYSHVSTFFEVWSTCAMCLLLMHFAHAVFCPRAAKLPRKLVNKHWHLVAQFCVSRFRTAVSHPLVFAISAAPAPAAFR